LIAPADYDGDGKTDVAVFRPTSQQSGAHFHILQSASNTVRVEQFGSPGDVPAPGDWDGDGKVDLAVYRSGGNGGQSYFFYRPSSQAGVNFVTIAWGTGGDHPVQADFDGDGRLDAAVYRPSNGGWYVLRSSTNQFFGIQFGAAEDKPVPADYDGDGRADIAVFRPSNGGWYRLNSGSNNQFAATQFGVAEDRPVPADYDGDGKADFAVWRPSSGAWYLLRSNAGFAGQLWGQSGDVPAPAAYIP
jgi:hypothetical protein